MITYITVEDVDTILGEDWAADEAKDRAVLMANVWLTNRGLPELDPIPDEWKQAGAEIAKSAASGQLYGAREIGVESKSVKADTVESAKSFAQNYQSLSAGEVFALALLAPWLNNSVGGISQFKLVRS